MTKVFFRSEMVRNGALAALLDQDPRAVPVKSINRHDDLCYGIEVPDNDRIDNLQSWKAGFLAGVAFVKFGCKYEEA